MQVWHLQKLIRVMKYNIRFSLTKRTILEGTSPSCGSGSVITSVGAKSQLCNCVYLKIRFRKKVSYAGHERWTSLVHVAGVPNSHDVRGCWRMFVVQPWYRLCRTSYRALRSTLQQHSSQDK